MRGCFAGGDGVSGLVLPAITLAAYPAATITRLLRSSLIETLSGEPLAQETFTERVNNWDKRFFPSEEELFRQVAWPWLFHGRESGFQGFMEAFADL